MFEKPTNDDFEARIRMRIETGRRDLASEIMRVKSEMSRNGVLRSSMTVTRIITAIDAAAEEVTGIVLGELRRTAASTDLDKNELRLITSRLLDDFFETASSDKSLASVSQGLKSGAVDNMIESWAEELQGKKRYWLRQFSVGFYEDASPEPVSSITNVLNASTIVGGVQQGNVSAFQHMSLDVQKITHAIAEVERELAAAELEHSGVKDIRSDLATIKAQLAKPEPNKTILREAGKSIRNVAEGVIGGLLTPQALVALSGLSSALGL